MLVHTTAPYRVAFYLPTEELASYGVEAEGVSCDWARRMTLALFGDMGFSTKGTLEIEAFSSEGGVMVFASLSPESHWETAFFAPDNFDMTLSLCAALNNLFSAAPAPSPVSILTTLEGQYILVISAPSDICVRAGYVAAEYARRLYRPAAFALFLSEHARLVVPDRAVETLAALR